MIAASRLPQINAVLIQLDALKADITKIVAPGTLFTPPTLNEFVNERVIMTDLIRMEILNQYHTKIEILKRELRGHGVDPDA